MKRMSLAAVLAAGVGMGAIAMAQDAVYTYTDERGSCAGQELVSDDERVTYVQACDGVAGWRWIAEASEHGQTSRFSDRNDPETGGQYGGYIGNFGQYHTVIEWRVGVTGTPYATIHRYISATFETGEPERQETLIVTALRPGGTPTSCHVGYVDASAVADANRIARDMADQLASDFDCDSGEIWVVDAASPSLDAALANGSTRSSH
ncbi:hypothetical protein AWH62_07350 [Maricaulis sp. W15]|uniref:DUF4124 domain-containing protein n=1 Tax=Maricaulis maris TaxID=74318 RepID=A0A495DD68_9PROT|nr:MULTISPECIES: hypothetical protein [Maricaulis]OLF73959.1 hypothetical protein AWH62_07350 [Maricaulis sp. W15]RKR00251.1 hypothetical protein C7435_1455 [Maricaulis maris]